MRRNSAAVLKYCIAFIWLANGLFCKLLGLVPRHELIVARILGSEHSALFTKLIGVSELLMSVWIMSNFKSRLNTIVQIVIIGTMNLLEFFIAPDLLLWGKFNAFFAFLLIVILYLKEFKPSLLGFTEDKIM